MLKTRAARRLPRKIRAGVGQAVIGFQTDAIAVRSERNGNCRVEIRRHRSLI